MKSGVKRVHELVEGIEAAGMSGLLRTVAIWVDPNGPSAECIQEADNAMDSAVGNDQYYDAALGMAACLQEALLAPPEPEEPEPEEPEEPNPDPDRSENLGSLMLAAFLAHLKRVSKT